MLLPSRFYISVSLNESSMNIVELANSEDPDKVAHNEMPHMGLHFWPSFFEFSI